MTDAVQLAKSVLAAEGQPFVTLSLAAGLPPVTVDSAVTDARRNYMRLAGAIHPDRLQGSFDRATEAFQCLVRAFETFADPKSRKKAAADALKKAKAAPAARTASAKPKKTETASKKSPKTEKASKKTKQTKQPRKAKRAVDASDEEDEEDEEPSESEEEEDAAEEDAWEEWAAADAEPEVSTSRTPIGQARTGGVYEQTTIGCPKCRSAWEPDSRPQYSLFMGHWGRKVHCQLCLFEFGCATALHNCPHCSTAFDYDVSMYDQVQTCHKCKKEFGFPYYPVNQHLIDQIALEAWKERKERERAAEREARARARRGDDGDDGSGAASEQLQLLIGTCIMDETCPLCHQRVKSKHRSHVLECQAKAPEERVAAKKPKETKAKPAPKSAAKAPSASKAVAAKKAAPKPATKAAPKAASKAKTAARPAQRKRRRGGSSTDSSDSEASLSASEEDDDVSSESSFDDDDGSD